MSPRFDLPDEQAPAFELFARLGKRVLRPGGVGLTRWVLDGLRVTGADVVELAPGRGATARLIRERGAGSYTGVDIDERTAAEVHADAAATGLPAASADVVVAEAVLTMQSDAGKQRIVAEAVRLLRPGGRFGVHELALARADMAHPVRTALATVMRVNARPLTAAQWARLLTDQGLAVEAVHEAPMALLQPQRMIADEGVPGAARFVGNVLRDPVARRRILAIRRTLREQGPNLSAVGIVAVKPG